MNVKALNKTTKSAFDIQMDIADKEAKHHKGVSFVRIHGNQIDYVHVKTTPEQRFKFFYNPSKLSPEERRIRIVNTPYFPSLIEEKVLLKTLEKVEEYEP